MFRYLVSNSEQVRRGNFRHETRDKRISCTRSIETVYTWKSILVCTSAGDPDQHPDPHPDPLVTCTDLALDPSNIKQIVRKTLISTFYDLYDFLPGVSDPHPDPDP
jgi:hypothetical protein